MLKITLNSFVADPGFAAKSAVQHAKTFAQPVLLRWNGVEVMVDEQDNIDALVLILTGECETHVEQDMVFIPPSAFDCTQQGHFPRLGV